jgi:hypothetical protein
MVSILWGSKWAREAIEFRMYALNILSSTGNSAPPWRGTMRLSADSAAVAGAVAPKIACIKQ